MWKGLSHSSAEVLSVSNGKYCKYEEYKQNDE